MEEPDPNQVVQVYMPLPTAARLQVIQEAAEKHIAKELAKKVMEARGRAMVETISAHIDANFSQIIDTIIERIEPMVGDLVKRNISDRWGYGEQY